MDQFVIPRRCFSGLNESGLEKLELEESPSLSCLMNAQTVICLADSGMFKFKVSGRIAQLVRALALQARGPKFES